MEPASARTIHSIIGTAIPNQIYSGDPYIVLTVDPKRTFLEKVFLLHEEFAKPAEKIRYDRMSRHHYDLEKLMDTEFGLAAMADTALYQLIVQHRAKFTPMRGIDYNRHSPATINFLPPTAVLPQWERDYGLMQGSMIYGPSSSFKVLLKRMEELRSRFRALPG
jgi:hypothetical protein